MSKIGEKIKGNKKGIKKRIIQAVLVANPRWTEDQIKDWSRKRLLANCHPSDRIEFEKELGLRGQYDNRW